MQIDSLIDAFVEKINSQPREMEALDEVPPCVREGAPDELWTRWRIVKSDNSASIADLENRLGRRFPPSFRHLVSNYCFPAFEFGPLMFFANTGQDTFWELSKRLFADPHMSAALLDAGFIQIGNPYFYNYDPICFDTNEAKNEYRIVQLDHEPILQFGKLNVIQEISPSFIDFLSQRVAGDA
jgi:hypothetical protein